MNILIKNFKQENELSHSERSVVLGAIVVMHATKMYDTLEVNKPHTQAYDKRLGCSYRVTKQGNGNLLIEFQE